DLVADSRLESIVNDTHTIHTFYESNPTTGNRHMKREERWTWKRDLGRGGYGTVRLETSQSGDQTRVRAIKEIRRTKDTSSGDFIRELEAIAKFSGRRYRHYFVRSYGWYETDQAIFIAMEYIEFGDLHLYLDAPFPKIEAGLIAGQLVEGLRFIHQNGFIHRDVKPQVKLTDFGITKRLREPREVNVNPRFTTRLFGTSGYVAPEITYPNFAPNMSREAARDYKFTIDTWGLSIVVFQLIFNRLPFPTTLQLSKYILGVDHLPLEDYAASGLSTEGYDFVKNALSASPAERPSMDKAWAYKWI
ncbi:kinase-like domain-containing protein, partial [Lasiosphaeria ovina]